MQRLAELAGKVSIITGASSGIGRATAVLFAKHKVACALVGRNEERLNETRKLCIESGLTEKEVLLVKADVTIESECRKVVEQTVQHFGRLNILVNNAGILLTDTVESVTMENFDRIFNVNVRSLVMLTNQAVTHLIASKGCVVNVSSVNGQRSFANVMSYCMTKATVDQFTRCCALDLAPKGVRVNAVAPGVTVTNLHRQAGMGEEAYQAFLERSKTTHALGRPGEVDEVADAILFLASDQSKFSTGVTLPVDGGRHAMCPR